jgi:hypothetical protein
VLAVDRIKELGWDVQTVDFTQQLRHENLKPLRTVELPDNEPGRMLASYPDYFCMHSAFPPKRGQSSPVREGAFFIAIVDRGEVAWSERADVLARHFPGPILVIESEDASRGYWLHRHLSSGGGTNSPTAEQTIEDLVAEIS